MTPPHSAPPAPVTVTLFVPGRLTNPLNGSHRHWSAHAKWAETWRTRTQVAWLRAGQPMYDGASCVTFVAQVPRRFDDDNLAACVKPIRDAAVRAILGTDDGPECGHWFTYTQEIRRGRWEHGVLVLVEPL